MLSTLESIIIRLEDYAVPVALFWLALLLTTAWAANWLMKRFLLRGLFRFLRTNRMSYRMADDPDLGTIVDRLANVIPALVIATGVPLIPHLPNNLAVTLSNVSTAFIVVTVSLAIGRGLTFTHRMYEQRNRSSVRPIKGYIQMTRIALYTLTAVLVIATLMDQSPTILLSGLGAMAAVLLFIFQHTLLSLVASVQMSSNDIIRLGDWVEMPELNANGLVFDIALHTVRIQNWDNTITSIPTKRFITDPFTNWRGMQESGGRRIMRSLHIDQTSVRFLAEDDYQHLKRFRLLDDYLQAKQVEIDAWNTELEEQGREPMNRRRITNIGCFRAYIQRYLEHHPHIHTQMERFARQLEPGPSGLPIEVYAFTNDTAWLAYERIQADIFDHLLAILPEFGLRLYQHPSGADLQTLGQRTSGAALGG